MNLNQTVVIPDFEQFDIWITFIPKIKPRICICQFLSLPLHLDKIYIYPINTIGLIYSLASHHQLSIISFPLLIISHIQNRCLRMRPHQIAHRRLHISYKFILVTFIVIIVQIESDVLTGFEYVVDDETFGEVGVEVIFDCLGLANSRVKRMGEVAFERDFAVWV